MILSIAKHIYSKLSASQQLAALVGGRIFPLASKTDIAYPFIAYERETVAPDYDKMAQRRAETSVSIYVVAETYQESLDIAEIVCGLIDLQTGTYSGFKVTEARMTGAAENFVNEAFVQTLTFNFEIQEI